MGNDSHVTHAPDAACLFLPVTSRAHTYCGHWNRGPLLQHWSHPAACHCHHNVTKCFDTLAQRNALKAGGGGLVIRIVKCKLIAPASAQATIEGPKPCSASSSNVTQGNLHGMIPQERTPQGHPRRIKSTSGNGADVIYASAAAASLSSLMQNSYATQLGLPGTIKRACESLKANLHASHISIKHF